MFFRPQNTTATVGTGVLSLDIHFDFINSTIAANSEKFFDAHFIGLKNIFWKKFSESQ